jgi:hypothetical protein
VKDALMAIRLTEIIFDHHDLALETSSWCAVLGYERVNSGNGWVAVRPRAPQLKDDAFAQAPALAFVLILEEKQYKNRVHIDITPTDRSQSDENGRLIELGDSLVDIGQARTT